MREIKFRAWSLLDNGFVYLNDSMSSIPYYEIFCHTPDSRAFEIQQYTGLKDKNGKEIYEGDIVIYDKYIDEVVWAEDLGCWHFGERDKIETSMLCDLGSGIDIDGEVVGNIYENPELLK